MAFMGVSAPTLLDLIKAYAINSVAESARKTETGQEVQDAVDTVIGARQSDPAPVEERSRVRTDSIEGQRRLAEMSAQLEAQKEAAMYGDPGMPTPEAPTQRKFGAPGLTFREGTPHSERGLNALIDSIRQQGINQDMAGFAASQGADDPSLDFTEPPASAYAPVEKVDPNTVTPIIRNQKELNDPEYERYKQSLRSEPLDKVNPADVKAINRSPYIDPDAPGEDMNSQIDQSVLLPMEEKVAVTKQQVSRMPAEVIEGGRPLDPAFWDSLDLTEAERQGLSANDVAAMYQAFLATKKIPEQVKAAGDDEGFLSKLGSSLGKFFGNERNMLIMASAFNTLRFQPDAQLEKGIQDRLTQIGTTSSNNKTAKFLLQQGYPDLAQMLIDNPGVKASDVLALYKEERKRGSWRAVTAEERKKYGLPNYGGYRVNDATGEVKGIGNQSPPNVGTIPKDYQLVPTEKGGWTLEVMEGSPTAKAMAKKTTGRIETIGRELGSLDELRTTIKENSATLGIPGAVASYIPGTKRKDAEALAIEIRANIGFDRLQQLREESPTGGALGQVAVQELEALQSVLGSLSFSQSKSAFLKQIDKIEDQYIRTLEAIANDPNGSERIDDVMPNWREIVKRGGSAKKSSGRFSTEQLDQDIKPVGR